MKSIHFQPPIADDMVRAILDNRKTVTRRVVKPQPPSNTHPNLFVAPPYLPGDILYVRETWQKNPYGIGWPYFYKASPEEFDHPPDKWHPSIHMPREAARIFLRVKDVRVERLQDITEDQARAEGTEPFMMTADVDKPDDEKHWQEILPALSMFPALWDSTIKPADRAIYGWEANPWVWVIELERCERQVKRDES